MVFHVCIILLLDQAPARFLLEPHNGAVVPSASFLRAYEALGEWLVGLLDPENAFVSSDGW